MHILHVTSSRFFGGPERQILELAREFAQSGNRVRNTIVSFSEKGLCREFLEQIEKSGIEGIEHIELENDTPRLLAACRELEKIIVERDVDLVCTNGYKASLVGQFAARRHKNRVKMVAVSRGWTAESWRVQLYERLDRWALRRMDHVVCVSQKQAEKVMKIARVPQDRVSVIHNAIRHERFNEEPDGTYREKLEAFFPAGRPRFILGAAGRLSPEKGFDLLITATTELVKQGHSVGVVLFGEGFLRPQLEAMIEDADLVNLFRMPGFTNELDRYMPHFDLFVQTSHTEGLPNVLLEASASGTPSVATDVGGTREILLNVRTGRVIPPADPQVLASAIGSLLSDETYRKQLSKAGRRHVREKFTFARQAAAYESLFAMLTSKV